MSKDRGRDKLGLRLRQISADLKLYIEKRMELLMLNTGEYFSGWMAASVQRALGVFLLMGGLGFLLFALAIYLGNLLGSQSLGYTLVSLPLLFVGVLFMYLKPKSVFVQLQKKFEAEVIKAMNRTGELRKEELESNEPFHSKVEEES